MNEIVIPTLEEMALEQAEDAKARVSKTKKLQLEAIIVSQHGVDYDGNMLAQSNMGDAGTIANWLFNKTLADSMAQAASAPDATNELKFIAGLIGQVYQGVYIDTKIGWKGADNIMHQVQGESVLEALHKTMLTKGQIIGDNNE